MHWVYERQARANLGKALRAQGAALYGWYDDRSEMENDYYHPESWDGVATYQGYTIVVSCSPGHAADMNDLGRYPAVQPTPKGYSWHVEKDGVILARGRGLSLCCAHGQRERIRSVDDHYRLPKEAAAKLTAKILSVIERLNGSANAPSLSQPSKLTGFEPMLGGADNVGSTGPG
jgi:hypothetical protein